MYKLEFVTPDQHVIIVSNDTYHIYRMVEYLIREEVLNMGDVYPTALDDSHERVIEMFIDEYTEKVNNE